MRQARRSPYSSSTRRSLSRIACSIRTISHRAARSASSRWRSREVKSFGPESRAHTALFSAATAFRYPDRGRSGSSCPGVAPQGRLPPERRPRQRGCAPRRARRAAPGSRESVGAVHVRVRTIACRSNSDGDMPAAAAFSCQAACSAGVTRATTKTVRRSVTGASSTGGGGRRRLGKRRGKRGMLRGAQRPLARPQCYTLRGLLTHLKVRQTAPGDRDRASCGSGKQGYPSLCDVLAPLLENLGAALQQVGSLIRLNHLASRDMGKAGLRDLRRNPGLGHRAAVVPSDSPRTPRRTPQYYWRGEALKSPSFKGLHVARLQAESRDNGIMRAAWS